MFSETIIHNTFETNSSFHVNQRTTRKVYFLFSSSFLLILAKLLFWQGGWALDCHSMGF